MDIAKRYSIAYKGLKNGKHEFSFDVDDALFREFESQDIKDGVCNVAIEVSRGETMLEIGVSISGSVTVECDRCLEDCKVPVCYDGKLLVKFSDEVSDYDGDVMWISPSEGEVSLAQYIYESIVLSLPYQRVHPEGECDPDMLSRFRIVSDSEFSTIESESDSSDGDDGIGSGGLSRLKEMMEQETKKEK